MKKGMLVVCLALSMVITASVFVQKTISATMKSQGTAYKGNNMKQEVIVYNDTTYVPLRNFSAIVGVLVDYKNGVIYLGDAANQSNSYKEKAEQIALGHAQLTKEQVKYVKNELELMRILEWVFSFFMFIIHYFFPFIK